GISGAEGIALLGPAGGEGRQRFPHPRRRPPGSAACLRRRRFPPTALPGRVGPGGLALSPQVSPAPLPTSLLHTVLALRPGSPVRGNRPGNRCPVLGILVVRNPLAACRLLS